MFCVWESKLRNRGPWSWHLIGIAILGEGEVMSGALWVLPSGLSGLFSWGLLGVAVSPGFSEKRVLLSSAGSSLGLWFSLLLVAKMVTRILAGVPLRICCRLESVSQLSHSWSSITCKSARLLPNERRKGARPFVPMGHVRKRSTPLQTSTTTTCLSGYLVMMALKKGPSWKMALPTRGAHCSAISKRAETAGKC